MSEVHLINGTWCSSMGAEFQSRNPVSENVLWVGTEADADTVMPQSGLPARRLCTGNIRLWMSVSR
jgi:hypothetical protein